MAPTAFAPLAHCTVSFTSRGAMLVSRQKYRMNMPLATIMRALFKARALGYYHSPIHTLPDPVPCIPIRIVLGVARPTRASSALVQETYGQGMRMKTCSQNTWRREVLESHLRLSRGKTSTRQRPEARALAPIGRGDF